MANCLAAKQHLVTAPTSPANLNWTARLIYPRAGSSGSTPPCSTTKAVGHSDLFAAIVRRREIFYRNRTAFARLAEGAAAQGSALPWRVARLGRARNRRADIVLVRSADRHCRQ